MNFCARCSRTPDLLAPFCNCAISSFSELPHVFSLRSLFSFASRHRGTCKIGAFLFFCDVVRVSGKSRCCAVSFDVYLLLGEISTNFLNGFHNLAEPFLKPPLKIVQVWYKKEALFIFPFPPLAGRGPYALSSDRRSLRPRVRNRISVPAAAMATPAASIAVTPKAPISWPPVRLPRAQPSA